MRLGVGLGEVVSARIQNKQKQQQNGVFTRQ